jgi:siroheme synthase (precorrin-2 oxidase/ferrochelatase)
MAALAVLPVFFDLRGRRVVVAGAGDALLWKAELVAAAGADVEVFTTMPSPDLDALSNAPPAGRVRISARDWCGVITGDRRPDRQRGGGLCGVGARAWRARQHRRCA